MQLIWYDTPNHKKDSPILTSLLLCTELLLDAGYEATQMAEYPPSM